MKKMPPAIAFLLSILLLSLTVHAGLTPDQIPAYSGAPYVDINGDVPFFTELMTTAFDGYGPLDDLGRCTLAYACVGPEIMPDEPRGNISSIHPSGWSDAQYEGIDGGNLFNRCHLIGYQLTGQNANERNLITGTRYLNTEGMLPFENAVADYIRETGCHVMYRVTPIYEGDNLVASGVLMEARSVEDPSIQYCAYCYNVQPGIEIHYATGESSGPGRLPQDAASSAAPAPPDESTYILNTNTMKFHLPACSSVNDIGLIRYAEQHILRYVVLSALIWPLYMKWMIFD